jgi:myo-inositol-1(or 4)-monophosphatase
MAEEGNSAGGNDRLWLIDPLDATVNYAHGIPFFAFVLAFFENEKPVFSLVNAPLMKEFYYAEKSKGAFLNGKRLKCDQKLLPERAVVALPNISTHLDSLPLFARAANCFFATRSLGCTALEFSYVAAGRYGARIKPHADVWDAIPACFIIEQAGGIATDFKGRKYSLESKDLLASANVKIHEKLLELVR